MILPPIAERELLVATRRGSTWWLRMAAAGVFLAIAAWPLSSAARSGTSGGRGAFIFLAVVGWLFCLFEGMRLTVESICWEKREGTLGLLFLTDLKPRDILLGKLAPAALQTIYSLLAIMPVLGLALLTGGVAAGEFVRVCFALLAALCVALLAGLTGSASEDDTLYAWILGLALLLFTCLGPLLLLIGAFGSGQESLMTFAFGLVLSAACIGALFWLARHNLMRTWKKFDGEPATLPVVLQDPPIPAAPEPPVHRDPPVVARVPPPLMQALAAERRARMERDPALWLSLRDWVGSTTSGAATAIGFGTLSVVVPIAATQAFFILVPFLLLAMLIFGAIMGGTGCRMMSELRRSGLMELLIATPLGSRGVLSGFRAGLKERYKLPRRIVLLCGAGWLVGLALGTGSSGWPMTLIVGGLVLAMVWTWFFAVSRAAMYFGFRLGSFPAAYGRTIFWCGLLPVLTLPMFGCIGVGGVLVLATYLAVVGVWADQRLEDEFARLSSAPLRG